MEYRVTGFWHLNFQAGCFGPQPSVLWPQQVTGHVTARRSDSTCSAIKNLESVQLLQAVRRRPYVSGFPAKLWNANSLWSQLTLNDHVGIAESSLQTIRYATWGRKQARKRQTLIYRRKLVLDLLPSFATVRFDFRRHTTADFLANHLVSSTKPAVRTSTVLKHKAWSKRV
jgi:hypothetical protein